MEKNLFERGKTKISVPLISCEDKNKEKMSLFEVVEIEKITKNKPSLLFTNNGSFFINNFSKNHRIFVEEKITITNRINTNLNDITLWLTKRNSE